MTDSTIGVGGIEDAAGPGSPRRALLWTAIAATALLGACETTPEPVVEPVVVAPAPEPEPVVEIYAPEPVPSITEEEYLRRQGQSSEAVAKRLEEMRLAQEAERQAELVVTPAPAPVVEPATPLTLAQRLARLDGPDARIALLSGEPETDETKRLLRTAYTAKLAADRASGDNAGAAQALVWLGEQGGGSRDADIAALRRFAEAQELDPSNARAPGLVTRTRAKLQSHADSLHERAVALFVDQDFARAVPLWETVLLIDPGNTAARDWFAQASAALDR